MKKILLSLAAAFCLQLAHGQEEPIQVSAGDFSKLTFGDNMNIVLKVVEEEDATVKFNKQASENLNLNISGTGLHITPHKSLRNQTVIVQIKKLSFLSLGTNTQVSTQGVLQGEKIDVYIHDNANARLKTKARVKAHALGETEVQVTRLTTEPQTVVIVP